VTAFTLIAIEILWIVYGDDGWWMWPIYAVMVPLMLYFLVKSNWTWSTDE
jgi:hypothetical protein